MASRNIQSILLAGIIAIGGFTPAMADAVPLDEVPAVSDQRVTVRVVNNNWSDMRVYVVQGRSILVRLGTVTSFATSKFQVPRWFNPDAERLQLVLRGIGGQSNATVPILVRQGDLVELRIEYNLSTSNVRVVNQEG